MIQIAWASVEPEISTTPLETPASKASRGWVAKIQESPWRFAVRAVLEGLSNRIEIRIRST